MPAPVIAALAPIAAAGRADAQMEDMLGRAYALAGRPDDAVKAFQKAASLAPQDAAIRTRLAATRLGLGQESAAIGDLEQSLKLAPKQGYAGQALVFAQLASGQVDAASASLAKLRQTQGDTAEIGNLTGMVKLAELDLPAARTDFEAVAKKYPDYMPARMNLAKVAAMEGNDAEAERLLSDMLAAHPAYAPAVSAKVNGLIAQKKPDAALPCCRRRGRRRRRMLDSPRRWPISTCRAASRRRRSHCSRRTPRTRPRTRCCSAPGRGRRWR